MDKTVQCEFELTKKEVLAFNFTHLYKNTSVLLLTIIGIMNLFFIGVVIVQDGISKISEINFIQYFLVILTFSIPLSVYFSAKRMLQNRFAAEKRTYVFSETGFTFSTPSQNASIEWRDIQRVDRTKNMILFYISPNCAHLIPVRSLSTAADLDRIYQWIKKYVKVKKRTKALQWIGIYLVIFLVTVGIVHYIVSR